MPAEVRTLGANPLKARLCLVLLEAQLATPEDWGGSPDHFLSLTFNRWWHTFGGREVNRYFWWNALLTSDPSSAYHNARTLDPTGRLYLCLTADSEFYGMAVGPAIEALRALDPRFPSMFWHRFGRRLGELVRVWDHEEAMHQEMWNPWWADGGDADEDGELAWDPVRAIPPCLKRKFVSHSHMERVLRDRCVSPDSWAGKLLYGALEFERATRGAENGWREANETPGVELFAGAMGTPAQLQVWFDPGEEGDELRHLWDYENDSIWNSGEPLAPTAVWAFDSRTVAGVQKLHARMERWAAALRMAVPLLDLLQAVPEPERVNAPPATPDPAPASGRSRRGLIEPGLDPVRKGTARSRRRGKALVQVLAQLGD